MVRLRGLSLLYTAVLVPVLAASLTAIWKLLADIGATLGQVKLELAAVRDETAPLEQHLQVVLDALPPVATNLSEVRDSLAQVDRALPGKAAEEPRETKAAERRGRPARVEATSEEAQQSEGVEGMPPAVGGIETEQ